MTIGVIRARFVLIALAVSGCADGAAPPGSAGGAMPEPPVVDLSPPVWPLGAALKVTRVERTHVSLVWTAAVDDVRMGGYRVNIDRGRTVEVLGTSTIVSRLEPGATYEFTVQAFDAAGNGSREELQATATTLGGCALRLPAAPQRVGP